MRSGRNLGESSNQPVGNKNTEDEEVVVENSSDEDESIQGETLDVPFPEALKEKRKKIVGD